MADRTEEYQDGQPQQQDYSQQPPAYDDQQGGGYDQGDYAEGGGYDAAQYGDNGGTAAAPYSPQDGYGDDSGYGATTNPEDYVAGSPAPAKEAAPTPTTPQPAGSRYEGNGAAGSNGAAATGTEPGDEEMRTIGATPSQGATSTTGLTSSGGAAGAAVSHPNDAHTDVNAILAVPDWIRLHPLLGAYLAECIGTFVFVLTVALVEINNPLTDGKKETNISSLPIGFMFMCMVLTFGYISGGHFNPCITLAVFFYERANVFRYLMYLVCQCGSALGAGIVAMIIKGDEGIIVPDVDNDPDNLRKAFFAELVISFALCTVVLNVAHRRGEPNLYSGMATGFVVTAGVASVGGVSGGAFNPALATGLQLAVCFVGRCTPLLHFWMYWIAPAAGAFFGAVVFSNLAQPTKDQLPGAAPVAPVDAQRIA